MHLLMLHLPKSLWPAPSPRRVLLVLGDVGGEATRTEVRRQVHRARVVDLARPLSGFAYQQKFSSSRRLMLFSSPCLRERRTQVHAGARVTLEHLAPHEGNEDAFTSRIDLSRVSSVRRLSAGNKSSESPPAVGSVKAFAKLKLQS
uniref:(northern house mosquito) hypothetical protein n=1 Tax=Culex pipiens TaxID=7175 RepID=A0A8D8MQ65_CULPI